MTQDQALTTLGLAPGATPDQVEQAHKRALQRLQTALPFAPAGPKRDAYYAKLAAAADAYTVLTGGPPPKQVQPSPAGPQPSRAARGAPSHRAPAAPPPRQARPASSGGAPATAPPPTPRPTPVAPARPPAPSTPPAPQPRYTPRGAGPAPTPVPIARSPNWLTWLAAVALFAVLSLVGAYVSGWAGPRVMEAVNAAPSTAGVSPRPVEPTVVPDPPAPPPVRTESVEARAPPAPPVTIRAVEPEPAPPPADPEPVRTVNAEQPESPGGLVVQSSPWAKVNVDGRYVDDAPWLTPRKMHAGVYALSLNTESGKKIERHIEIRGGRTTVVTWIPKEDRFEVKYEDAP